MRNSNGINSNVGINMRKTNIAKTITQDALLDKPLKLASVITMTENMADGFDSGLAPVTIIEQMIVDDSHFSRLMAAVAAKLRAGQKLSDALKCFPNATPEYYRALIEAGEISSNWTAKDRENPNSKPGILDLLLVYLKRDAKIRTKVAGAMVYPSLIMGFLVLAVLIITFYVLPRLKEFFIVLDLTKNMNFATASLLAVGDFTEKYYWAIPVGIVLAIALAIVFWRTGGGKELWHKYQFDMYIVGKTIKKIALAEIFSLFSTLHSAGIGTSFKI
jgi:type II secretory pathway component PulF